MPKFLTATILAATMLSVAAPATAGCPRPLPQGPKKPDSPICEQPFDGSSVTLNAILTNIE